MENFELIDDYLRGQLEGQEKEAFEKQLQADPSLQSEVALQQQLIDGIKKARVTQLKTMLNQVPITSTVSVGSGLSAGQIVTGVITSALVVTGTLFYFKPWKSTVAEQPSVKTEQPAVETTVPKTEPVETKTPELSSESKPAAAAPQKKTKNVSTEATKVKPNIQVVDPTEELTSNTNEEKAKTEKDLGEVSNSRLAVDIDNTSKKYAFHYQFNQGKLILYGKFDKGLYEIIEVNGSTYSIFLYYKDRYYQLNEKDSTVTPLTPITDGELIKKLKAYRKG